MIAAFLKKIISSFLIVSIILPAIFLSTPNKTNAQFVVTDPGLIFITEGQVIPILAGLLPGSAQKEGGLFGIGYDGIAWFAGRILLRQITQSLVNWINSGFQGNPSFIQDPKDFLEKDIDRTIGNFIESSDLNFLCAPFQINVKLALGLQYSPFADQIGCRLTDILNNTEGAYEDFVNGDFIGGGGWDSWLSITTVPQNNQLGAMLIAQNRLDANINNQIGIRDKELSWGNGSLSLKKCSSYTYNYTTKEKTNISEDYFGDPVFTQQKIGATSSRVTSIDTSGSDEESTETREDCQITTPGHVFTEMIRKTNTLDVDALNMADEINEIVGALANFVVSKAMEKGYAALTDEELSPDNPDWRAGLESLKSQQYQSLQSASAVSNPAYMPGPSSIYGDVPSDGQIGTTPYSADISEAKANLLSTASFYAAQEQTYYNIFATAYNGAATTSDQFKAVNACYSSKLASTTINPPLTNSEKNLARAEITQASTSITMMTEIIASTTPILTASYGTLTALSTISTNVTNATTLDALTIEQNNLAAVIPYVHTVNDIAIAESIIATTTTYVIIPSYTLADTMKTECEAFPDR
jgi:hypothetical protein